PIAPPVHIEQVSADRRRAWISPSSRPTIRRPGSVSRRSRYRSGVACSRRRRLHRTEGTRRCVSVESQGRRRIMNARQTPIRVLSVDDHPLLREGVASLLAGQADLNLVAEASNGREAVEQFRAHRPDVTLMDLQMPEMNGVEAMI